MVYLLIIVQQRLQCTKYPNITVVCVQCTGTYSGVRLVDLNNVNFLSRIVLFYFTDFIIVVLWESLVQSIRR